MLLPFAGSVVAYLVLRSRRVPVWFDILVIAAAAAWPAIIWFRPQLVAVDQQDLLEIQDMVGVLVPFWATVVGIPIVLLGAFLRRLFFLRSHSHASRNV